MGDDANGRPKQIYCVVESKYRPEELTNYDDELRDRLEGEKGQNRFGRVFKNIKERLKRGKLTFWRFKSKETNSRSKIMESNDDKLVSESDNLTDRNVETIESNYGEIGSNNEDINEEDTYDEQLEAYKKLHRCKFYWGPITSQEAEQELRNKPDGTFLIRDSCSARHVYSLSFRSWGRTLHTRIDFDNDYFKIFSKEGYSTINLMLEAAMELSKSGVYCFTQSNSPLNPSYPVRLLNPLSRFTKISSLKHMCRFVIREHVNINDINNLHLPETVKNYLMEPYFK